MKFNKINKTNVKVNFFKLLKISLFSGFRIRLSLLLGKIGLGQKYINFYNQYISKKEIMHLGKLSDDIINDWKTDNVTRVTPVIKRKIRLTNITDEIINDTTKQVSKHQKIASFIDTLLKDKSNKIKNVIHIGARVDTLSAYFSNKYSNIKFSSVDLQPNMREINSVLEPQNNWTLHNDYALSFINNSSINYDLIIMISTSPKFNNLEFDEYIKAFKKTKAKYILFYEPWWALPLSFTSIGCKKPEDINPNISPIGGMTCDFHHNYFYKLNKYNFAPVISEIKNVSGEKNYNDLFIFAVNEKLLD